MNGGKYDCLKLENQLCFPLYAASKEIVNRYKPYLAKIDLTYTQYIVMMVMWEQEELSVKELGQKLFLDSGTITPVVKKLEQKGFVKRQRCSFDERLVKVKLTEKGESLKEKAVEIPAEMAGCVNLEPGEAKELYRILYKLLGNNELQR